jgi:hypothetical protein
MSKSSSSDHPENLELPERSCENCFHGFTCGCYGQLIIFINRNMSFFNKTKLPPGVNPTIVNSTRETLARHCLYYIREGAKIGLPED